jgi:uncharacterized protein (TIGR00251 family)
VNRKFEITSAKSGAAFTVRVVTRSAKTEIAGIQEDGTIKIRLTASPSDGSSNQQLIDFLAERLGVPTSAIDIVAGKDSRDKMISVEGISADHLEARLKPDEGAQTGGDE